MPVDNFTHAREDGVIMHLNAKIMGNGAMFYYFSKAFREETSSALPSGYVAVEEGKRVFLRKEAVKEAVV